MKIHNSTAGYIKLITLKQFLTLEEIPVKFNSEETVLFDTLISNGSYGANAVPEYETITEVCSYERCQSKLVKGNYYDILENGLLLQTKRAIVFKKGALELFEDLCLASLIEFGESRYLVRLAPRTWLIADPQDYKIYVDEKKEKFAIANMARVRGIVHEFLRVTEDEAKKQLGISDAQKET